MKANTGDECFDMRVVKDRSDDLTMNRVMELEAKGWRMQWTNTDGSVLMIRKSNRKEEPNDQTA